MGSEGVRRGGEEEEGKKKRKMDGRVQIGDVPHDDDQKGFSRSLGPSYSQ